MQTTFSRRLAQLNDAQRERAIELSHRQLVHARDNRRKLAAWRILIALVKGRSPEVIARLERERGLERRS